MDAVDLLPKFFAAADVSVVAAALLVAITRERQIMSVARIVESAVYFVVTVRRFHHFSIQFRTGHRNTRTRVPGRSHGTRKRRARGYDPSTEVR